MRLVNYSYHYLKKKYLKFLIKFTTNLILSHVNYRYHYLQKKYIGFVIIKLPRTSNILDKPRWVWQIVLLIHGTPIFKSQSPLIFFILSYMQMLFCFLEYPDRYSFLESCSLSFRKERRKYLQGAFQKNKKKTFAYK